MNLLRHNRRFGRHFPADLIADLLNVAAEIPSGSVLRFTKDMIVAAFSTGDTESVIPLANFGIEHSNSIVFTHVSQRNQPYAKRQATIGCFSTVEDARNATAEEAPPSLNLISDDERSDLMQFLKKRPTNAASQSVPKAKYEDALAKIKQLQEEIQRCKRISPNGEDSVVLRYLLNGEAGEIEIDSKQTYISIETLLTGIERKHLTSKHCLLD